MPVRACPGSRLIQPNEVRVSLHGFHPRLPGGCLPNRFGPADVARHACAGPANR
ncbi:hypothetical protein CBM2599_A150256 [Cupriavidus taiwanensis]|nr:hypothetical protein CBM2599_A150256 [Cupriavidus taiwanensis]SOY84782.1 hypothetical protein CBM2600_A140254 [Cupriavidus taiwanensis]